MPRFSVTVPAHRVQAYLPACLESVLSPSCPDLELIAVDDCSPDACGALADEFATRNATLAPDVLVVDHLLAVHTRRDRLPRAARTEFLGKSRAYYRRYRPLGTQVPPRSHARHALLRVGLHRTYGTLRLTSAMCRRAARQSVRLIRSARAVALRLHYRIQLRPTDPLLSVERFRTPPSHQGVPLPSSPTRPTPTRPHTWRPAGRPGRATS